MSETSGHFAWQDGYAAISVSPSQVDAVRAYIDGQEQHHAKRTYEQEITTLLDKSGVSYDREHFVLMSPLTRLLTLLGTLPGPTRGPGRDRRLVAGAGRRPGDRRRLVGRAQGPR